MAEKGPVDILSSTEAAKTPTKLVKINIFRTSEVNKSIKQSTEHVFKRKVKFQWEHFNSLYCHIPLPGYVLGSKISPAMMVKTRGLAVIEESRIGLGHFQISLMENWQYWSCLAVPWLPLSQEHLYWLRAPEVNSLLPGRLPQTMSSKCLTSQIPEAATAIGANKKPTKKHKSRSRVCKAPTHF